MYHSDSHRKTVIDLEKMQKTDLNSEKQLGQFYCKLLLQVQKRCNSSVIPIFTQFIITQLCHFTNQAQGDRRMIFHPEIDTK